jgi:hypothetical protein
VLVPIAASRIPTTSSAAEAMAIREGVMDVMMMPARGMRDAWVASGP